MADTDTWPPRVAQQQRLRDLDALLAARQASIDARIERAVLLNALGRRADAQQAFVELLLEVPTHFTALNEFATVLSSAGFTAASCRVYAEAVAHHPANPVGHVNLANLLMHGGDLVGARQHYESALRIDPDHAQAHQGLGAVLAGLGDRAAAQPHFDKGFRDHFISSLPYRGDKPPVHLLLLVSSGSGNIPVASFLDDRIFATTAIVADYFDMSRPLPPHRIVFNSVGDADLCVPALKAAVHLTGRTSAPVINNPSRVIKTGRIANAKRLRGLPGVITPRMSAVPRSVLVGPDGAAMLVRHGLSFPLLLRSPGFHTGHHFAMVHSATELSPAAAGLPGDELLAIEYLDARGPDGQARKYRAMIVDGEIYPMHLAVSRRWKVHYFTADMADRADYRAEDAAFLGDMTRVIGGKAVAALRSIAQRLGLDYGGIDFGLSAAGDVLLFEANATMVVNPPDPDARWAYRRQAVDRILDAAQAMLLRRAADAIASSAA
jgi:hypothetical protein